ncbi:hypothetical protein EGH25_11025 [Haladaptatus sp. F3-133]|uniref:SWIM-type domain-containing protein n=1 Tax=Halorutilus salinus TaxID=2487751 RepID=A0A9Q4C4V9_9EURY|nr:hypothetical protein [Halorutilus salinus]MCX2819882.1 hypothetical protein [Halorutilus salinus]
MTTKETSEKNVSEAEPRTVRALEEYLTVLPEHGRVKGADDLVLVVSASPEEYVVDLRSGACECPDASYNLEGDELCKHARCARFALGRDAVPAEALEAADVKPNFGVRQSEIDEQTELRSVYAFVDTDEIHVATPDGGVIEATDDVRESEDSRANENAPRSRDGVVEAGDDSRVLTETNGDACGDCAELPDKLPCFECYMREINFEM